LGENAETSISLINAGKEFFQISNGYIDIIKPLDVPPRVSITEYTVG